MTVNTEALSKTPELLVDYDTLIHHKSSVDSNIALLDLHLRNLSRQRERLLRQRSILASQADLMYRTRYPINRLPIESITPFLLPVDVCNMSATSRLFNEKCKGDNNILVLSHFVTPTRDISGISEARDFIGSIRASTVETMHIDAKKTVGSIDYGGPCK